MKTSSAMCGIGTLFWVLFLMPYLCVWSSHGEESCKVQLYLKRQSLNASLGNPFSLECPVNYCTDRPNVTWCKLNGTHCLTLQRPVSWKEEKNSSALILHFEAVVPSDNGSYRCSANVQPEKIESHWVTIYVLASTDIPDTIDASEPPSTKERADRTWLLYSLPLLGGLPVLIITCFCLFCCLRSRHEKKKKPSDTGGREINLVDVPQLFNSEQTTVGIRQNSHTVPPETGVYDDPRLGKQEGSEVYSNPRLEENKQGIVYASLNHSIIGMNSRPARNVKEAPTEYASICVRS
ncbi:B- and T-lymphocyte attenuator [Tupaia chinensis]|uniref:B-and T-lymphocyte attenuator n=1 Tax=Tupaia chinensis TaxID=246437 RepID=L9KBD9_TUPCH|nr:B- and T-lymphocyte attenuator [Tupaia chinensis]ELW59991.1 B- and T-lymphocyte attenuator [Tupaia chinensis]